MARRPGVFGRFSLLIGDLRGLFVPFGLFALLAAGIHVGTDRLDDHLFLLYNVLDGWTDEGSGWVIRHVASWFNASKDTIDSLTFRAADFIDIDVKQAGARWSALGMELAADVILALPVFLFRKHSLGWKELVELAKKTFTDPTMLKFAGPLAAVCAGLAGAFVVSREIQVLAHSMIAETGLREDLSMFMATLAGFLSLVVIVLRLGSIVTGGAISYADRRASNDRSMSVAARKRIMRGAFTSAVALPIAVLAIDATPILGTIRALLWM